MNEEIEKSIIKTYRKEIWSKFIKSIKDFELVKDGDSIAVCISGGKDSFLLAKCMQELRKHGKIKFELKFILMNPGYNKENLDLIINNSKKLNIDLHIFNTDIFEVSESLCEKPCYLCARMRRGHLYNEAKNIGCNKIALGHHFDDVVETILLSMFYASEYKTMLPKLHSDNFEGMELIRPLYYVKEEDIIKWSKYNNLQFINCACKMTEKSNMENISKRKEIKNIIKDLKKNNPNIDMNVFKSAFNVNLNTILGYYKSDNKYFFLDDYDNKKS